MIVHTKNLPSVSNNLKIMLVWMDEEAMRTERNYNIKRATSVVTGHFEKINYKINVNTYERVVVDALELNDIASCRMVLNRPIAADEYKTNRLTGSFIVIDRITNNTVGAGMIVGLSRRNISSLETRDYTQEEKELNAYVREHFPEWDCKAI
jgi:sulfate adenylyltransferase subunit 1